MGLEIQNITNSALRKAAEKADSQGENAYNGILDENEISLFLTKAKEAKCDIDEAQKIAYRANPHNAFGGMSIQGMQELEEIIKSKETELYQKKLELDKMTLSDGLSSFLVVGGAFAGVYTAPVIGAALEYYGHIGHCKSMLLGGVGGLLCSLGLAFLADTLTKPNKDSYKYKVQANKLAQQKDEYYNKEIKPLEEEIAKLKHEQKLLCQDNK